MKKLLVMLALFMFVLVGCSQKDPTRDGLMDKYEGFKGSNHHFVGNDDNKFVTDLENKVEGIYYMGFAECPWCKELVPVLEEVASEKGNSIQYLNVRGDEYQNSKEIQERLQKFIATLPESDQNNNSVPFVLFVDKDGNVVTHLGTVDGHDAPSRKMTEQERNFLKVRLEEKFDTVQP